MEKALGAKKTLEPFLGGRECMFHSALSREVWPARPGASYTGRNTAREPPLHRLSSCMCVYASSPPRALHIHEAIRPHRRSSGCCDCARQRLGNPKYIRMSSALLSCLRSCPNRRDARHQTDERAGPPLSRATSSRATRGLFRLGIYVEYVHGVRRADYSRSDSSALASADSK